MGLTQKGIDATSTKEGLEAALNCKADTILFLLSLEERDDTLTECCRALVGIPCRILVNQLRAIPEQGLWALWRERLLFMAILLLYLMIAARCLWGNLMIPVALVLYGIGQGIVVSFLLMLVGLGGIGYILLGILLPRTVQLVALILMCNLAHSRCEQMSGAEGGGQATLWILSALLLAGGGLLESTVKWKMIAGILS